jgi:membrane-anchored glycerophosphoryl diester phosphodiesterase (GDPDase)
MIKFETQNEERERRKRQREREWHLFMDEISLLQDKLNTLKQRKTNVHESIEEQIHSIQVIFFLFYIYLNCGIIT